MCYVHNQWYDISCATLYYFYKPQRTVTSVFTGLKPPHFCSNNIPSLVGLSVVHGVLTRNVHTEIIKMDLTRIVWEVTDWVQVAQDKDSWRCFVNAVMNLRVP